MLRELELRGTVGGVAASLGYSPSSVSQHLRRLEREVGVALLEPDGRGVRLTEQGRAVARHAEEVMELQERVRARLGVLESGREVVRVAAIATATRALIPRALDLLRTTEPGLRVEVSVVAPELGLAELQTRRYDLAIAEEYPGHTRERREGIDYAPLGEDPIRIALAPDAPARSLAALSASAWVLEPPGTAARHWAEQQCRASGFEPDVRFEATDLDTHVALIAARQAVGLLPDLIWARGSPPVTLLDLPTPLRRTLFTAVRSSAAPAGAIQRVRAALGDAFGQSVGTPVSVSR